METLTQIAIWNRALGFLGARSIAADIENAQIPVSGKRGRHRRRHIAGRYTLACKAGGNKIYIVVL